MTSRRFRAAAPWVVLAALAYVPLLLTARGQVGADTKQYLWLDPGRLLERAPWMWDSHVGAGTVTHQQIGYLWPMGPFAWVFERLGTPDWVTQRLWLGTLLFLAGTGVLALLRALGGRDWGAGPLVAALAYMLTPYSLEYSARISVILLPWAVLPWLLLLLVRALREGGWRYPAAFALVAMTAGSVNATSLVYAGVAPVLWVPYAVWVARETTGRRALATVAKVGALTVAASLWWIAGLVAQAGYGLDVLAFTETVEVVASTALPSEALRGLGNWFFYGRDKLGPWIEASLDYTQRPWVIATSFAVSTLALLAAAVTRWRHRVYFAGLVVVGTVIAVGVHPYDDPSPLGAAYKALAEGSSVGLALRSVGRAVPLVALGLAVLLGAGVEALARRARRTGMAAVLVIGALVLANLPPLWKGTVVDRNLRRPEALPAYWEQAAAHLSRQSPATRVLELPGSDFAAYRWGNTVDPITPGLTDRPYLARELIPFGSPASADLLIALDRRLQEGVFEPAALAPIARLLGVGDVVLRSDLQYERYRTPRPRPTWALFDPPPAGLERPARFGPATRATPVVPMDDEQELATPAGAPDPPEVAVFPVADAVPIVRAEPARRPVLVAGDAEGLVDAAAAGILEPGRQTVLFSASIAANQPLRRRVLAAGAELVLTDSNRRRARGWGIIRETTGYTEQAGERPLADDPRDARLPVFPDAGDDAYTITEQRGVRSVRATHYGNPVSFTPGDRPALALDGDPRTAWTVGAFSEVVGERVVIELERAVTVDHVTLVQPLVGPRDRFITRATVELDDDVRLPIALGEASRTEAGQRVDLGGGRTFRRLEIRVDAINTGRRADYRGNSGVGFAEVRVGDVRLREVLRLPTDLLTATGTASLDHPLTILLARARGNPSEDFRAEEELALARTFSLPTARSFSVAGTARVSAAAADDVVDRVLGRLADVPAGGAVASSSARLPGFPAGRAAAAFDGDPSTFWSAPRGPSGPQSGEQGPAAGQWVAVALPRAVTVDHLDLQVVADGRHSTPSRLRLEGDGATRVVDVPPVADGTTENHVATVHVSFPPLTTARLRVVVEAAHERLTEEYFSEQPIAQPVAIAEIGAPGVRVSPLPADLPGDCRTDLLEVDGRPVGLRLVGPTAMAERREGVTVEPCAGDGPLVLDAGAHEVRTHPGRDTGIDVDRLVLASAVGGQPAPAATPSAAEATDEAPPRVEVIEEGRASYRLRVHDARRPFWLVLGQSHNDGWKATIRGGGDDLGPPVVVDGYANGWLVTPSSAGDLVVDLTWTPQQWVWRALAASAAAVAVCLLLVVVGWARRRRPPPVTAEDSPTIRSPFTADGAMPATRTQARAALAALALGGLAIGPGAGIIGALLVVAGLRVPRARGALALGSATALALAGVYMAVQQTRYRFPPLLEWPTHFERAGTLGWLAVGLLATDLLVDHVRTHAERTAAPPTPLKYQPRWN